MRETILIIFIGNGGHFAMSFLDATGLGTFWGKLKNYFVHKSDTEAPVTGLTDMLTPVNILPNSDFSRSGGYKNTVNLGTINYSTASSSKIFRLGYAINPINTGQDFSNVVTVTQKNSITIDFDINSVAGGSGFGILSTALMEAGKTYTLFFKMKLLQQPEGAATVPFRRFSTTQNTILASNTLIGENTWSNVYISKNTGTTSGLFSPAVSFDTNGMKVGHYKIQFYDCALYDGEFKNPPVITSLDVKAGNRLLTNDLPILNIPVSRGRFASIEPGSTGYFIIGVVRNATYIKDYFTVGHSIYEAEISHSIIAREYLSCRCLVDNNDSRFVTKLATLSFSGEVYYAIYLNNSAGNMFHHYEIDGFCVSTSQIYTVATYANDKYGTIPTSGYTVKTEVNITYPS